MNDEEQRKRFAMMIADVIHQVLQESDDLTDILAEASDEGYDIFLTVFSGVMLQRRDDKKTNAKTGETPLPEKFEFSQFDREFLQSIGIRPPEEEL